MGREYNAIYMTKDGNIKRYAKHELHMNAWGSQFWGHVWDKLGLDVDKIFGFNWVQFPHVIVKQEFEKAKDVLTTATDEQLREAIVYGLEKLQHPQGMNNLDDSIKHIHEGIIPLFQKRNAIGIVSDYVEMKMLKEELEEGLF